MCIAVTHYFPCQKDTLYELLWKMINAQFLIVMLLYVYC